MNHPTSMFQILESTVDRGDQVCALSLPPAAGPELSQKFARVLSTRLEPGTLAVLEPVI